MTFRSFGIFVYIEKNYILQLKLIYRITEY